MSKQRLIGAFVIAAAVVAILVFSLWQPREPQLTPQQARGLLNRKNVANGQLENQQLEESIPVFEEIGRTLRRDPLGPRNLAVARIVALGEEFQHATPERRRQAREALSSMRRIEGESVSYHWLSARLAAAMQDNSGAASHLSRIVEADPDNASAWFELFQRRKEIGGAATQSAAGSTRPRRFITARELVCVDGVFPSGRGTASDAWTDAGIHESFEPVGNRETHARAFSIRAGYRRRRTSVCCWARLATRCGAMI